MNRYALPISIALLVLTFSATVIAQVLSQSQERTLLPKDTFKECDLCPEMVVVPAGVLSIRSEQRKMIGNKTERRQQDLIIRRPFALGKFEVTVEQFGAFIRETGYDTGATCFTYEDGKYEERTGRSWRNPGYPQHGSYPAACMNFDDAEAYVDWLSRKTGRAYRLPSEAEWNYTATSGAGLGMGQHYVFGNTANAMCAYAYWDDESTEHTDPKRKHLERQLVSACSDGNSYATPSGTYAANGFGLFDMNGNVWEWIEDCYNGSYHSPLLNGAANLSGDCSKRGVRGGSWNNIPWRFRAGNSGWSPASYRSKYFGFRVARALYIPQAISSLSLKDTEELSQNFVVLSDENRIPQLPR